jgi:hypothetical protein
MKILYITNHNLIFQQSGGYLNDYLNDLLFYGFTELEDIEVIDSTPSFIYIKKMKQKSQLNTYGVRDLHLLI